jgi:hypothetical protein
MIETAKTESWWSRLAQQTEQERAADRKQAAQDRAERMRTRAEEQQTEPKQRRRKGLRP